MYQTWWNFKDSQRARGMDEREMKREPGRRLFVGDEQLRYRFVSIRYN